MVSEPQTPIALDVPLDTIGLDPRPTRQIRQLDMAHVRHLIEDTLPAEWDPIELRLWPESDPYPPGEAGRRFQVVSGYHRTTAARAIPDMATIRAIVVDAPDDTSFTLRALKGNLRHGKLMSPTEQRAAVVRLRALGMSLAAIAKETGIPKGTVHNWLSGRDTNAGRLLRTQSNERAAGNPNQADHEGADLDDAWRVMPSLESKRVREVGSAINDLLATTYEPPDVLAWVVTLPAHTRLSLVNDVDRLSQWLKNLRVVLANDMANDMAQATQTTQATGAMDPGAGGAA